MSTNYKLLESLGPAHPSQVSVTVAEATERERRGIPMPISGDPVPMPDPIEREWARNNPGQPSPFDTDDLALMALADLERQHRRLQGQPLRGDWVPVADEARLPVADLAAHLDRMHQVALYRVNGMSAALTAAAPVVETEAAGLNFRIEGTQLRLAVIPIGDGSNVVALIDEETGQTALVPLGDAALIGNQLTKIGHALQHDELELRGLGLPVVGVGQFADRLGEFLDGARNVPDVLVVGLGRKVSQFGSLLGMRARSVKGHENSPSVGAPGGAVFDSSEPTEGDLTTGPIRGLFPSLSHEALTASITALAATQRRFMIGGRLAVAP